VGSPSSAGKKAVQKKAAPREATPPRPLRKKKDSKSKSNNLVCRYCGSADLARDPLTYEWDTKRGKTTFREIVRQQWSFGHKAPQVKSKTIKVNLDTVSILELAIKPDLTPDTAFATLTRWRMI
jgi:hypothetical protein